MDRRNFIKGCCTLSFYTVLTGCSKATATNVKIAHISDTQFGMAKCDLQEKLGSYIIKAIAPAKDVPEGTLLKEFQKKGTQKEIENFTMVANAINKEKPDFVFVTGDMVQYASGEKNKEMVALLKEQFKKIDSSIPVYFCPGNHDVDGASEEGMARYLKDFGYDRFSVSKNGVSFIGLNTEIIWAAPQNKKDEHFAWITAELEKAKKAGNQIYVLGHRPIFSKSFDEPEGYNAYPMAERKRYAELLKKYGVKNYLCGHLHERRIIESPECCTQIVAGPVGMTLDLIHISCYYTGEITQNGYKFNTHIL